MPAFILGDPVAGFHEGIEELGGAGIGCEQPDAFDDLLPIPCRPRTSPAVRRQRQQRHSTPAGSSSKRPRSPFRSCTSALDVA